MTPINDPDAILLEVIRDTTLLRGYRPKDYQALSRDLYIKKEWLDAHGLDDTIELHVRNAGEPAPDEGASPSDRVDSADATPLDFDAFLLKTVERRPDGRLSMRLIWNRWAAAHRVSPADTEVIAGIRARQVARRFKKLFAAPNADGKGLVEPHGPSEHFWSGYAITAE